MAAAAHRLVFFTFAMIVCAQTGCLGIPLIYAYPNLDRFAVEDINAEGDVVTAVVGKVTQRDYRSGVAINNEPECIEFKAIKVRDDRISETTVSTEAFAGWTIFIYDAGWQLSSRSTLRLYRRDYHTIEIDSQLPIGKLPWKETSGIAEEERSVDDLIALTSRATIFDSLEGRHAIDVIRQRNPEGQVVRELRDWIGTDRSAYQFAADEYEHIARKYAPPAQWRELSAAADCHNVKFVKDATNDDTATVVVRLLAKAKMMRALAEL